MNARLFGGRYIHLGTTVADSLDGIHHHSKLGFLGLKVQFLAVLRPLGNHNALPFVRERLPDLLGDKGHKGMQQLEGVAHHIHQYLTGRLGSIPARLQTGLGQLDIPVAENIPDKVIDLLYRDTQLKLFQIVGGFPHQSIILAQQPFILNGKGVRQRYLHLLVGQVHQDKAGGVPQLVGKVAAGPNLGVGIPHIVSGAVSGGKGQTQGVGAKLVNDFQRVHTVTQGFGHLASLLIPHQAMNQHRIKGGLSHMLHTGEDHSGHPEEDDVITGHQSAGGIEMLQLRGFIRPSQRGERPESGGEPGIQRIGVLLHTAAAAFRTGMHRLLGDHRLPTIGAVVGGNPMAPPQLTGDTPVFDVVHPVKVDLLKPLGDKLGFAFPHHRVGGSSQRRHLHKPLFGDHRLDGGVAAVAGAYLMGQRFHRFQCAAGFQICQNGFSGLHGGHPSVFAAVQNLRFIRSGLSAGKQFIGSRFVRRTGHMAVVGEYPHAGQVVAFAHFIVVGVMGRGDLNHTGTLFHIGMFVADDGNLFV